MKRKYYALPFYQWLISRRQIPVALSTLLKYNVRAFNVMKE